MEEQLGVSLFDRTSRQVVLTPAGRRPAGAGPRAARPGRAVFAAVREVERAPAGTLGVGFSPTARFGLAPALLAACAAEVPGVMLYPREDRPASCCTSCAPAGWTSSSASARRRRRPRARAPARRAGGRPRRRPAIGWRGAPSRRARRPARRDADRRGRAGLPRLHAGRAARLPRGRASSRARSSTRTRTSGCRRCARASASSSTSARPSPAELAGSASSRSIRR